MPYGTPPKFRLRRNFFYAGDVMRNSPRPAMKHFIKSGTLSKNMFKIYEIKGRKAINRTKIPEADWAISYYVGCQHSCIYCFLKFLTKWRKQKEAWGDFVDVKTNAPDLVAEESKDKEGKIILCACGDPYQPVEKKYELTKKILQKLNPNMELLVLTKSDLIVRDVDLFKRFKKCYLGLTITTFNEDIKKVFEPFSPSSRDRLNALKELKKAGFYTYVFVGPILPYLTDLEEIFKEVSPYVDHLTFEDLNMSPCRKEVIKVIDGNFPELKEKYLHLSKEFWLERVEEIEKLGKQYNKPVRIYFKSTGSLQFK